MLWDGKKVRYKTGKGGQGQGIGTVTDFTLDGKRVKIRTANGKEIIRKVGSIIGEYEEPAPQAVES